MSVPGPPNVQRRVVWLWMLAVILIPIGVVNALRLWDAMVVRGLVGKRKAEVIAALGPGVEHADDDPHKASIGYWRGLGDGLRVDFVDDVVVGYEWTGSK